MTEAEIRALCHKSREIFLSQPILLELEAPLKICGTLAVLISKSSSARYLQLYELRLFLIFDASCPLN